MSSQEINLSEGFYWVMPRSDKGCPPAVWQPAELKDGRWWIIGDDGWWPSDDFLSIDTKPIKRESE